FNCATVSVLLSTILRRSLSTSASVTSLPPRASAVEMSPRMTDNRSLASRLPARLASSNFCRTFAFKLMVTSLLRQFHAGTGGLGDQLPGRILDRALDIAERAPCLHDGGFGRQRRLAHCPEKIDLQFDRCEGLAIGKCGGVGQAHGGVGQVTVDAAVER